jgi:ubiquitin conjugation factor E4 B
MEKLSGPAKPKSEQSADGNNSAPSPSSAATPKPTTPENVEPAKPKITIKPAATPAAGSENPFTKLTSHPTSSTPSVRNTPEASLKRPRAESVEQSTTNAPPRKTSTPVGNEDIDAWENRTLGQIFRITLDPNQKVDASNHRLVFLPNLRQELEEENAPIRLSQEKLSDAITEAASIVPHNKPVLDYLLPCWKRVMKAMKNLRGYANAKDGILKEAKRLCMSNCVFAITLPELFG